MRHLFLSCLFLPLLSTAKGPYSVLLVTGDTLTAADYRMKGDTLELAGLAALHWKDILVLWDDKERWTFTYPHGRKVEFREELDGCGMGHLFALRFEKLDGPFDSLPIPPELKRRRILLPCYRARLESAGIFTDENGGRVEKVKKKGTGGVAIGKPSQIIFLKGDTMFLKKEFYHKDSLLCWYGGKCLPVRDILLFRTMKGQFYYKAVGNRRLQMDDPIPDMSVQSLGRLHANRFLGAGLSWESAAIPDTLKNDPAFVDSYRTEVVMMVERIERAIKKHNTMSIISGGLSGGAAAGAFGAVVHAGINAATGTKIPERSFWNSPMPPE